jgi:hypothetical protein
LAFWTCTVARLGHVPFAVFESRERKVAHLTSEGCITLDALDKGGLVWSVTLHVGFGLAVIDYAGAIGVAGDIHVVYHWVRVVSR